mmetsp:Transcript_16566/g.23261  ORF Transcript_16566/g.23261 Transcript_16566/m.23261 type:complete len:163 (-) Transcript_16566:343-831(-)|eukprot:CAMPEP_0175090754 /NCGR_PEP_ID=MMETSP0086_2-20121207/1528_1 /TAXON_ID=136419 /ORGANISM="Unknown Unknown, Strain D1" /LENGTH=162 /DNA_ID=CAMNT_0016363431 /DNA_START=73 /DNA_END=561 /DNA_ORIENTATION=-
MPVPGKMMARASEKKLEDSKTAPTPFQLASRFTISGAAEEVTSILTENPKVLNQTGTFGTTLLHIAAQTGQAEMIELLVKAGASVNQVTQNKETALHLATAKGHCGAVQTLLKLGADAAAVNTDNLTALDLARSDEVKTALASAGSSAFVMAADDSEDDIEF